MVSLFTCDNQLMFFSEKNQFYPHRKDNWGGSATQHDVGALLAQVCDDPVRSPAETCMKRSSDGIRGSCRRPKKIKRGGEKVLASAAMATVDPDSNDAVLVQARPTSQATTTASVAANANGDNCEIVDVSEVISLDSFIPLREYSLLCIGLDDGAN